ACRTVGQKLIEKCLYWANVTMPSEGVCDVEFWPVQILLKTEAAVSADSAGPIVGIEYAIAQARRNGRAPLVSDRPIALRRRAPVVAADIALEIDEPFVVDTMASFHSDDLVNPLLPLRCETGITAKGRLQLDRAVQVEIARAEGCVDPPIGICSRDSHSAVCRGDRLVEGQAGVHAERSRTPFDEAQADPEEGCADDEIFVVGDEADRDIALEMREQLEDVGVDGEGGKAANAQAGAQARRPTVDRRLEMPVRQRWHQHGRWRRRGSQVRREARRSREHANRSQNRPCNAPHLAPPKPAAVALNRIPFGNS